VLLSFGGQMEVKDNSNTTTQSIIAGRRKCYKNITHFPKDPQACAWACRNVCNLSAATSEAEKRVSIQFCCFFFE